MKSVFPIVFFGFLATGCVNLEARMPETEIPDWIEERRAERLEDGSPPPVVPDASVDPATISELQRSRAEIERGRAALDEDIGATQSPSTSSSDEFVEEGRTLTGEPD